VTTDREALLALLTAVDRSGVLLASRPTPQERQILRIGAERARRHLLLTEAPDGDCAARIDAASDASYAAGVAHGVDARPDRPQGYRPPIPSP
jgi:type IV secretory pathway VirJ component